MEGGTRVGETVTCGVHGYCCYYVRGFVERIRIKGLVWRVCTGKDDHDGEDDDEVTHSIDGLVS